MTKPLHVLLDTDVYSALHINPDRARKRGMPVDQWMTALSGLGVVLSFQSRAEVLAGMAMARWGERRVAEARERLDSFPTIGIDYEVIESYASLSAACRRDGHALHDKAHTADRWIAACAIAKRLPLLSGDGIYRGAQGLDLLDVPAEMA